MLVSHSIFKAVLGHLRTVYAVCWVVKLTLIISNIDNSK